MASRQGEIALTADLDAAELREVRSDELRIEQREATRAQLVYQLHEAELRRVGPALLRPAEHALAEERRADVHAV
jgi:hypothetical protein